MVQQVGRYLDRWLSKKLPILLGILAFLSITLTATPSYPQSDVSVDAKQGTASVSLDGQTIFKVSDSEEFDARQRADLINDKLLKVVQQQDSISVNIQQGNVLPTIWLGDDYLMTVTERDAQLDRSAINRTVDEQARRWAFSLQAAIDQAIEQRSSDFIRMALLRSIAVFLGAVALHRLLKRFWCSSLKSFVEKLWSGSKPSDQDSLPKDKRNSIDLLLGLTLFISRTALWFAALFYIAQQFPQTRRTTYHILGALQNTLTTEIVPIGNRSYSIPNLLILGSFIWALVIVAKLVADTLRSRVLKVTGISRGAQEVIAIIIRYALVVIGVIVLLQVWGVDLSSLTIIASALGVGIGFGFQDIAKNFGSGIVLLFERPVQVGDFIEIGNYTGIVERVGARSTVVKTLDKVSIIVPNSRFLESEITNWHHDNPVSGLRLPVGVAYGSNLDKVRQSLLEVARSNPDVLNKPAPQVLFTEFGDSSLNFELRVWSEYPSQQVLIKSELLYQIDAIFRKNKIEIPFPQRDLYVKGNMPLEVSPEVQDLLTQLLQQQGNNGSTNYSGPQNS
ncbi:MAG: mechanosensitive ion channel family protein [Microcoleaceae cyanobacterium]